MKQHDLTPSKYRNSTLNEDLLQYKRPRKLTLLEKLLLPEDGSYDAMRNVGTWFIFVASNPGRSTFTSNSDRGSLLHKIAFLYVHSEKRAYIDALQIKMALLKMIKVIHNILYR